MTECAKWLNLHLKNFSNIVCLTTKLRHQVHSCALKFLAMYAVYLGFQDPENLFVCFLNLKIMLCFGINFLFKEFTI